MIAQHPTADRLAKVRQSLDREGVPAMLVTNMLNIRWLTGFTGSYALAFVSRDDAWIAVDSRYRLQAEQECKGLRRTELSSSGAENLAQMLVATGERRIAVESDDLTVATYREYCAQLEGKAELVPIAGTVRDLRNVKDSFELEAVEQACAITDEAFAYLCGVIKPGMTERDVTLELEWRIRKHHRAEMAFPTIGVSGPRTAMPHGHPTERVLQHGEFVTLDFGAQWAGYCSDITRTVVLGKANEEQRCVYGIVLEAQRLAIDGIKPGAAGKDVDALARRYIAEAGHGEHFGHGLGHSVGLEVHDGPSMSPRSTFNLEVGMVMTVEPGIYVPDWAGVRIEDDVVVTDDGCRVLTKAERGLIEL